MSDIKSIAQIKQEFEQSGDDKEALYVQEREQCEVCQRLH